MQLQAGRQELADLEGIVSASTYGRGLRFAHATVQPIGAPPAAYANPDAPGFSEMVRTTALNALFPEFENRLRTDALMTFEAWLLLMPGECALAPGGPAKTGA